MINAFQHIGMGVKDIDKTYSFYRNLFGFKVKLNDVTMASKEMEPVIGSVETMRIIMAANVKGGGILEFVEHKSSPTRSFPGGAIYGSYGVLEIGFGVRGIDRVVDHFRAQGVNFLTPICDLEMDGGRRWQYAYLKDTDGMRVQLVEDIRPGEPDAKKPEVHGVMHVAIGVSDIENSKAFYKNVLGFDQQIFAYQGHMADMDPVSGGPLQMNLAILERSAPVTGPVKMLPAGTVKLLEVPDNQGAHVYKGRRWGDIGCMEFCMDVSDLEATVADAETKGAKVYLPPVDIDMGSGSRGKVAYIRDPDGTVVEFVEIITVAWISASTFMRFAMPLLKVYDRITGG
jgi:catechol 2,3-dioxygenase-like lactoylglutathione lyase family enzyme